MFFKYIIVLVQCHLTFIKRRQLGIFGINIDSPIHIHFLSRFDLCIVMAITKYPAKQNAAKVAANLGLSEGLVYLKGDVLKERHDTDVVSVCVS